MADSRKKSKEEKVAEAKQQYDLGKKLIDAPKRTKTSDEDALKHFFLAAGEYPPAYHMIGKLYHEKANYAEAIRWYELGAKHHLTDSLCMLGTFYVEGQNAKLDIPKGLAYLEEAAKEKNPMAFYRLAVYHLGQGNTKKAQDYHLKAEEEASLQKIPHWRKLASRFEIKLAEKLYDAHKEDEALQLLIYTMLHSPWSKEMSEFFRSLRSEEHQKKLAAAAFEAGKRHSNEHPKEAQKFFLLAEKFNSGAAFELANLHQREQNKDAAKRYASRAMTHPREQLRRYLDDTKDYTRKYRNEALKYAAEQGDIDAQLIQKGRNNIHISLEELQEAAKKSSVACILLGHCYHKGRHVHTDQHMALRYYQKAFSKNDDLFLELFTTHLFSLILHGVLRNPTYAPLLEGIKTKQIEECFIKSENNNSAERLATDLGVHTHPSIFSNLLARSPTISTFLMSTLLQNYSYRDIFFQLASFDNILCLFDHMTPDYLPSKKSFKFLLELPNKKLSADEKQSLEKTYQFAHDAFRTDQLLKDEKTIPEYIAFMKKRLVTIPPPNKKNLEDYHKILGKALACNIRNEVHRSNIALLQAEVNEKLSKQHPSEAKYQKQLHEAWVKVSKIENPPFPVDNLLDHLYHTPHTFAPHLLPHQCKLRALHFAYQTQDGDRLRKWTLLDEGTSPKKLNDDKEKSSFVSSLLDDSAMNMEDYFVTAFRLAKMMLEESKLAKHPGLNKLMSTLALITRKEEDLGKSFNRRERFSMFDKFLQDESPQDLSRDDKALYDSLVDEMKKINNDYKSHKSSFTTAAMKFSFASKKSGPSTPSATPTDTGPKLT